MTDIACCSPGCNKEARVFALFQAMDGTPTEVSLCKEHLGDLGIDYLLPDLSRIDTWAFCAAVEECVLHAVVLVHEPQECMLVLRSKTDELFFVVPTGYVEACWVVQIARKTRYPATPTHELIANIVRALGASVLGASVYAYDANSGAFKCSLSITAPNGPVQVDCRISDAVAISLVSDFPIMIAKSFLGRKA